MNFKDLQFSIGKLTTDIRSQMARRNPLQSHDTKALNLWVFEERNDVASLKTCSYHHKETDKAFLSWITEEVARNPQENEDIEDIGKALFMLLEKQAEIEKQYAERYQLYRRALKSMREREKNMTVLREKKEALQDRIQHLKKSNGKSPKLQDLEQELQVATSEARDKEMELGDFKRFILREAFYLRFNALHEYGEKSAILAGHGKYLVDLLDIEPTPKGQTNRRPFTHDASMILMDALLTVDGWKDADERPTTLDGEYDQDASELTDEQIKPASCSSSECSVDMEEKKRLPFMEKSDYHQLYKSLSHIQQQPVHRTYSEFQQQFDSKEKEALKSELPPAYEDDGYHYAKDVKKKE